MPPSRPAGGQEDGGAAKASYRPWLLAGISRQNQSAPFVIAFTVSSPSTFRAELHIKSEARWRDKFQR
jgi:hypothetical protein